MLLYPVGDHTRFNLVPLPCIVRPSSSSELISFRGVVKGFHLTGGALVFDHFISLAAVLGDNGGVRTTRTWH